MAKIQEHKLPEVIYCFCTINKYSKAMLNDKYFYLASPKQLNDPLEAIFYYNYRNISPEKKIKVIKKSGMTNVEIKDVKHSQLNQFNPIQINLNEYCKKNIYKLINLQVGIKSFSSIRNNYLLWAHYANGFKGLRIGFKTANLLESFKKSNIDLVPVLYTNELLSANLSNHQVDAKGNIIGFPRNLNLFNTKLWYWEYEKEFRFISTTIQENRKIYFDQNCIESLSFGLRCSKNNIKTIENIFIENYENSLNLLKNTSLQKVYKKQIIEVPRWMPMDSKLLNDLLKEHPEYSIF